MTPKKSLWVYLTDMHSQASIRHLETGQILNIHPGSVDKGAPIGLRGYTLEQISTSGVQYRETGEQLLTIEEELFDEMAARHQQPNSWIFDHPNYALDSVVDVERHEALRERLTAMMAKHPLPFKIIGLQERSLLYFTDGSYQSQKKFLTLMPTPGANPYRRDGQLKTAFTKYKWSSEDRDNNVQIPSGLEHGTPCLYAGRAWVVRFELDGQYPAFGHCRVYVMEDGTFIASDWCQRHDFSSYKGHGINLQMGIFSFDGWIMGPCLQRAIQSSQFVGKTGKVKVEHVRDLAAKEPLLKRQTLEEALADATKAVKAAKSSESGGLATIQGVVGELLIAKPELTDAQIITGFQKAVRLTLENKQGDGTKLAGVPIIISGENAYIAAGVDAAQYEIAPAANGTKRYRFTAGTGACGATLQPGKLCIKPGADGKIHSHPYFSQVELDEPGLTELLQQALDELRQANKPDVEVPPITATAMQEALLVLKQQQEKALEKERTLLLASLATVQGLTELDPTLLPSVQPMLTTSDTPFGVVQIKRQTEQVVQVTWVSGPFEGVAPAYVRYTAADNTAQLTRKLAKSAEDSAWEDAPVGTPVGDAVRWYFTEFLPTQVIAQEKALEKAVTVDVNADSFRCYPVVDGATLCRVVNGAVSEAVTVRQKANGHIYRVQDTGATALLEDEILKVAARKYFLGLTTPSTGAAPTAKKELVVA